MSERIYKTVITGDWHPIYKALRSHMVAKGFSWNDLVDGSGVAETTLQANFCGKGKPFLENAERVANSLGFHLCLVPMDVDDADNLNAGKYVNPGIMEANKCEQ